MIRPIYTYGQPVLRKKAQDIPNDGSVDIKQLVADMFETMYAAHGVGLAAPQIGLSQRIFVVDAASMEEGLENFKKVFINPQIIEEKGQKWEFEEGCLSIPDIRERVARQADITIEYYDQDWKHHKESYSGIAARIIQHEYDHIEGILFTDHISTFRKQLLKNKLDKIAKGKVEADYRILPCKK
ncbi:peptide deformylase [Hugenholtzia roseola]|uniref:peptide deformylase n=1 Tax=Hugenholtzia roseola TaxID=1002 RepID=UPI000422B33E|nr:peptide deformylase [Hugenholtzia roseola]